MAPPNSLNCEARKSLGKWACSRLLTSCAIDSHLKSANMPYNRHLLPKQLQELVPPACLLITHVMRQKQPHGSGSDAVWPAGPSLINKE